MKRILLGLAFAGGLLLNIPGKAEAGWRPRPWVGPVVVQRYYALPVVYPPGYVVGTPYRYQPGFYAPGPYPVVRTWW